MSNILDAIYNISKLKKLEVEEVTGGGTRIEQLDNVKIFDDKVQNPNNPANLIECKVIRYER